MTILDDTKSWLETVINQEKKENNGSSTLDQLRQEHLAEERRLRSEAERIALERSHVIEEEETLREREISTETTINAQINDAIKEKKHLEEHINMVMSQIDELEKQLIQKRELAHTLTTELSVVDESINEVRHKFQRQFQHIEDRKNQVQSIQMACNTDEQTLEEKWTLLRSNMAAAETARQEQECLCHDLKHGIDIVSKVCTVVSSSSSTSKLMSSGTLPDVENNTNGDIDDTKQLQQQLSDITTQLISTVAQHRDIRHDITKLSSDLTTAMEKVQSLERDKKNHAVAKRFREAAAVAKDEKICLEHKEELDQMIAEKNLIMSSLAKTVETLTHKQREIKHRLEQFQRKIESSRLSAIITRKKELNLVYDCVKNENGNNTDDALTGIITEDVHRSMRWVLETEMTLLDMEADEIRRRHGQDIDADNVDDENEGGEDVKKTPETTIVVVDHSTMVNLNTTTIPTVSNDVTTEEKQLLLDIAEHQQKQNEAVACEDYELAASMEESIVQTNHALAQLQGTNKKHDPELIA